MFTFAMIMSALGAVIVMPSAYVVSCLNLVAVGCQRCRC